MKRPKKGAVYRHWTPAELPIARFAEEPGRVQGGERQSAFCETGGDGRRLRQVGVYHLFSFPLHEARRPDGLHEGYASCAVVAGLSVLAQSRRDAAGSIRLGLSLDRPVRSHADIVVESVVDRER